jgi:ribosomal protein S6E (S10)
MTVQTNTNVASFNGNGVTQIFPIAFKFNNDTDLVVLLVDDDTGASSTLTLNSDYTVSGEGDEEGGLVNVVVAPTVGQRLKVTRIVDILQLLELRNQGKFFGETHEDAFDLLTMIAQQHQSEIASSIRVAESDPEPSRLPPAASRANMLMAFDSLGNPIASAPASGDSAELALNLANSVDPSKGASLVGYAGGTVAEAIAQLSEEMSDLSGAVVVANVSATATPAENTAALQAQAAASEGMTLTFPAGVFEFDAITLTTNVRMSGQGAATVLRLADASGGHLLTSSANLVLTDLVLDQNRQNNLDRMKSAISFSGTDLYARNVSFKNTMFAGVHVPNVATEKLTLIDCDFESMAEHSGTMGEQTQAVNCRVTGACKVVIRGGNVTHGVPADVDAAPGGFIFDGAGIQSVEVSGVTFRNIGQRKASNFIGAIDLYTNCRDVTVHGNKVFNYYYVPFKFQNCLRVVMTGNIVNGVADAAANQAVVFQNARDHQAAVVEFTCTGNVLIGTSQLTDAIYVQGDPDRIFDTERVTISGNVIRAFRYGINTSYVKGASMSCNDISLSVDGVYIRDVINGSTFSISGGRIANSSSRGIAAIGASGYQVNLTVSGVTLEANSSFHVDANFAARLTVAGCNLIGSPTNDIRSQNNGMAVITGNNNGSTTASLSILTGTTKQAGNSWN